MNARYVGETLGEYNTMEVQFEDLHESVELARYIRNHVIDTYSRKGTVNAWELNVLKGQNISCRQIYDVNEVDRVYSLEMDIGARKKALKAESKMPISLKAKMSINKRNKVYK